MIGLPVTPVKLVKVLLLVRGEDRLAAEFDAVRLRVGPAARGALQNAAAFELGRYAENRKDDLGEVSRNGSASDRILETPMSAI